MTNGYEQFFKEVKKQGSQSKTKFQVKLNAPESMQNNKSSATATPRQLKRKSFKLKRPGRPPIGIIVCLLMGAVGSIIGLTRPKTMEKLFNHIEIGFFGEAGATEAEKSADAAKGKEEKSASGGVDDKSTAAGKPSGWTQEEINSFSKLNERKKELDQREAELNKLEEELQQQKLLLDKRVQELTDLRAKIADAMKERVEVDKEKVDKLVEFYSNMKPQQAAKIIESLDEDLAVETLSRMKKKNAAEIMNLLDSKKAQAISEKFAGYRR